ncbi:MAG TPA: hypothetical protein DEP46_16235 [Blastocatellia bacterium]|nr:hypothetical protein [Blastocatellia bacterium]
MKRRSPFHAITDSEFKNGTIEPQKRKRRNRKIPHLDASLLTRRISDKSGKKVVAKLAGEPIQLKMDAGFSLRPHFPSSP